MITTIQLLLLYTLGSLITNGFVCMCIRMSFIGKFISQYYGLFLCICMDLIRIIVLPFESCSFFSL